MKKIAIVFASAGLMALAACGGTPANETANTSNEAVENVIDNAANVADNAADNAANVAENAANAN